MKIKLIDFNGPAPVRAHDNDAGADVFSPRDQTIYPGQVYKLPLGFGLELPDGYVGYIFPRSSLSARGIVCELRTLIPAIAERSTLSSRMSGATVMTSRKATVLASS